MQNAATPCISERNLNLCLLFQTLLSFCLLSLFSSALARPGPDHGYGAPTAGYAAPAATYGAPAYQAPVAAAQGTHVHHHYHHAAPAPAPVYQKPVYKPTYKAPVYQPAPVYQAAPSYQPTRYAPQYAYRK